jgi:hypothetical protein
LSSVSIYMMWSVNNRLAKGVEVPKSTTQWLDSSCQEKTDSS